MFSLKQSRRLFEKPSNLPQHFEVCMFLFREEVLLTQHNCSANTDWFMFLHPASQNQLLDALRKRLLFLHHTASKNSLNHVFKSLQHRTQHYKTVKSCPNNNLQEDCSLKCYLENPRQRDFLLQEMNVCSGRMTFLRSQYHIHLPTLYTSS